MNSFWGPWIFVFVAAVNTCIGNLLLKRSRLEPTDSGLLSLLLSPWFLGGLVFYGINVVLFAKALEKLPVSTAYPVFAGIGFALIAISGSWFFREHFSQNHWIGLAMILAGIIIMSRS
ncbi:MAG: multidrug efflux SMR transporter [Iphinoe sp. HA4291-MV1]|jgi:multidrug transporter EmrE-like cation transporter|nr:multidrug efflux SMR transporter [Iphinoe sp. HA4291-MV1]